MAIPFNHDFNPPVGEVEQVSPLIARLLAGNPGPFTFRGTGVYLVGTDEIAVIDPGPLQDDHLVALKRAIEGKRVTHILLTHTHSDHSPAAAPLKEWTGARTYAYGGHPKHDDDGVKIEESGDDAFRPDVFVKDGDIIKGKGFTFECVFTPGHTSNHMAYALLEEKALFTGDHVMGWSTTVVAPPDGNMTAYFSSLAKLQARDDVILYPTHGAPIREPKPFLAAYYEHRKGREAQVLSAIKDGLVTIPEMVAHMYAAVDKKLHPAASRSVLAHLNQLEEEGRVKRTGPRYALA